MRTLLLGLAAVTVCFSQTYNISGIVTDTGTTPIAGALVRLEKAGLSVTSGADGRFTLSGTAGIQGKTRGLVSNRTAVTLQGGRLSLDLQEQAVVQVQVYSVQGRLLSTVQRTMGAGIQAIPVLQKGKGICLYSVKIGSQEVFLKGNAVGGGSGSSAISVNSVVPKQAMATDSINDVIAATKTGYLNYRCVQYSSDTAGVVIKMIASAGTVRDTDGNVYQTVRIGNQVWMAENLRVTRYNDGSAIPLDTSTATWEYATTPKYCFYKNTTNADSIKKYGAFYNWYCVNPLNSKKIAPAGWHVPTNSEWTILENYLVTNGYNWDGTTTYNRIGKALAAKTDWKTYTTAGTIGRDLTINNRSGFSALPGGYRNYHGYFSDQSSNGFWWSATKNGATSAWFRRLDYNGNYLVWNCYTDGESDGNSVRLVKD